MNPDYLWLTGAIELLTFFLVGPVLAIGIAYAAWRGMRQNFNPRRYWIVCMVSGVTAFLLLGLAKWMNVDVRTPEYFLQLTCVLFSGLLFGVCVGSFFPVLVHVWRSHKATRLADHNQAER